LEKDFEKDLEKLVEKSNERLDRTKKFKEEVAGRIDSLVVEEVNSLR
jgi:hypothetical protein